jgi:hypothetical protein
LLLALSECIHRLDIAHGQVFQRVLIELVDILAEFANFMLDIVREMLLLLGIVRSEGCVTAKLGLDLLDVGHLVEAFLFEHH